MDFGTLASIWARARGVDRRRGASFVAGANASTGSSFMGEETTWTGSGEGEALAARRARAGAGASARGGGAMFPPPSVGKTCNCKNSRCLKLYCECFAGGFLCRESCRCVACRNNEECATERRSAVEAVLERNPNAFRPKIAAVASPSRDVALRHNRGCHCKRSNCLKKYCECFQAAIYCAETCRCVGCENHEGSNAHEEVKRAHGPHARFHDHASAAASPSPSRRKMLAERAEAAGLMYVARAPSSSSDRSPKRPASHASVEHESPGGAERAYADARAMPLMHNLVQQGAVEELARILLVVADETKRSGIGTNEPAITSVKPPSAPKRGVAAVAELAAIAAGEIRAGADDFMCDEDAGTLGARVVKTERTVADASAYAETERQLLGELERVLQRLKQNAAARAERAKAQKGVRAAKKIKASA